MRRRRSFLRVTASFAHCPTKRRLVLRPCSVCAAYSPLTCCHSYFVYTAGYNTGNFLANIDGTITLSCHINDFEVRESGGRTTTPTNKLNGKQSGMNLVFQDLQTSTLRPRVSGVSC